MSEQPTYRPHIIYDSRWFTDPDRASVLFCGSLRECRKLVRESWPSAVIVTADTEEVVPNKSPKKGGRR